MAQENNLSDKNTKATMANLINDDMDFEIRSLDNILLDCPRVVQMMDEYGLVLPSPKCSRGGLGSDGRIPFRIEMDDVICSRDVKPDAGSVRIKK